MLFELRRNAFLACRWYVYFQQSLNVYVKKLTVANDLFENMYLHGKNLM